MTNGMRNGMLTAVGRCFFIHRLPQGLIVDRHRNLRLSCRGCLETRSQGMTGYEDSPAPRHEVFHRARQGADAEQASSEPLTARTQVAAGACGEPRGVTWGRSPGGALGARGQPEVAVLRRSSGWQFPGLWRRAAAGVTRNTAAAARARRQRADEEEAAASHAICATAHLPSATAGAEAPE